MSDRYDDDAFARNVAAHYAAPPMTPSQRTRFDARLEERVQRGASRPWLAAGAVAAAVAALLFWQARGVAPTSDGVAQVAASDTTLESAATPEEWILATGSESLDEADDGLPVDYVAISDLLLAGE